MNDTTAQDPAVLHVRVGQRWVSRGGAVWAVKKRRSRVNGFIEALIETTAGATRWVSEADLRGQYRLAP